jgi:hypothetical protein
LEKFAANSNRLEFIFIDFKTSVVLVPESGAWLQARGRQVNGLSLGAVSGEYLNPTFCKETEGYHMNWDTTSKRRQVT